MLQLETFLESIESLPVDTKRNLTLIAELDRRATESVDDAKRKVNNYLEQVHNLQSSERTASVQDINKRFKDAVELTEQKQAVVLQTYQLIDRHIRRLDANLSAIVQELDDDQASACSSEKRTTKNQQATTSGKSRASSSRSNNSRKRPLNESKNPTRRGRKPKRKRVDGEDDSDNATKNGESEAEGASGDEEAAMRSRSIPAAAKLALRVGQKPEELLLAVDPNEPVYCICKRVSYGEMIACDNPDCTTEWYHLDCVNLKVIPRGKWFCPTCRADRDFNS